MGGTVSFETTIQRPSESVNNLDPSGLWSLFHSTPNKHHNLSTQKKTCKSQVLREDQWNKKGHTTHACRNTSNAFFTFIPFCTGAWISMHKCTSLEMSAPACDQGNREITTARGSPVSAVMEDLCHPQPSKAQQRNHPLDTTVLYPTGKLCVLVNWL
jgi:hypothetical protein